MSHHIPFEIQIEIIKRLPVKSLIQFRSVQKQWKSLIDSSDFITGYNSLTQTRPQRLLIRSFNPVDENFRYFSFIDDDTNFPEKVFSKTVLKSFDELGHYIVGDSSHGLFCLTCSPHYFVLWNPAIRKSVTIEFPCFCGYNYGFVFRFGVCPDTLDPKFVKIEEDIPLQVEVFSLSRGAWRSPLNLPFYKVKWFIEPQVVIDRFIYWLVYDYNRIHKLMLFDLISENLSELYLPDCLAQKPHRSLSVSKLRESLVVFESNFEVNKPCYGVWMMTEHSASKSSFTKLYNVSAPDYFDGIVKSVLGFWKSGEPIIVMENNLGLELVGGLYVYEPCAKNVNDLGIVGNTYTFYVNSYRETLLLLDRPHIFYMKANSNLSEGFLEQEGYVVQGVDVKVQLKS